MNIIYYHPLFNAQEWLAGIKQRLPQAEIREWQRGDERPADYALVWRPPHEMLANRRDLKAVFALGAGVDAILDQERKHPGTLPAGVPLLRLEDTGMAQQMPSIHFRVYTLSRRAPSATQTPHRFVVDNALRCRRALM